VIVCDWARMMSSVRSPLILAMHDIDSSHQAMYLLCSTVLMSGAFLCFRAIILTLNSARLVLGNLAAWSHGSCVVYPSEIYDPKAIVDSIIQDRCTALHGVPTHFLGVLAEVQKRQDAGEKLDLSCLR
jgi:acyl-CoA synthetase (AMP-forming)/AMP-acid ligase II